MIRALIDCIQVAPTQGCYRAGCDAWYSSGRGDATWRCTLHVEASDMGCPCGCALSAGCVLLPLLGTPLPLPVYENLPKPNYSRGSLEARVITGTSVPHIVTYNRHGTVLKEAKASSITVM